MRNGAVNINVKMSDELMMMTLIAVDGFPQVRTQPYSRVYDVMQMGPHMQDHFGPDQPFIFTAVTTQGVPDLATPIYSSPNVLHRISLQIPHLFAITGTGMLGGRMLILTHDLFDDWTAELERSLFDVRRFSLSYRSEFVYHELS